MHASGESASHAPLPESKYSIALQGCQSRPFWLELEPFFGPAPAPTPTPILLQYSTVNILFLRDPKYDNDYDYYGYVYEVWQWVWIWVEVGVGAGICLELETEPEFSKMGVSGNPDYACLVGILSHCARAAVSLIVQHFVLSIVCSGVIGLVFQLGVSLLTVGISPPPPCLRNAHAPSLHAWRKK